MPFSRLVLYSEFDAGYLEATDLTFSIFKGSSCKKFALVALIAKNSSRIKLAIVDILNNWQVNLIDRTYLLLE